MDKVMKEENGEYFCQNDSVWRGPAEKNPRLMHFFLLNLKHTHTHAQKQRVMLSLLCPSPWQCLNNFPNTLWASVPGKHPVNCVWGVVCSISFSSKWSTHSYYNMISEHESKGHYGPMLRSGVTLRYLLTAKISVEIYHHLCFENPDGKEGSQVAVVFQNQHTM